jgi:hypothetical protein
MDAEESSKGFLSDFIHFSLERSVKGKIDSQVAVGAD